MADSSSQNSDSSNSSSQHVQNSQPYQMPYTQYHQQQLPYNYQMPQPYQMSYPQYPQQFPYNSSGTTNFPLHFQHNSGGSNFPQQFQGSLSGGLIFPQQVSVDHHTGSSIPQHSSQIPVDLGDDDDVEEAHAPTPNTKDTKAIWTPDEDIKLVNSWYNVCTDSIIGNQQKKKEFWMKITAFYNQCRPEETIVRSYSQVKNHYYKFNPDLTKWAGIYNNFWSNRGSGQDDNDVLEAAKKFWRNSALNKKDFKYLHMWDAIQKCEKWTPQQMPQNPQKKSKNTESDSPSSTDTGPRMRPMGQQKAKRLAKQKGKITSTESEEKWKHLQEALARQMSIHEEQLKLQHWEYCAKDTSGMSEDELYNYNLMATEIKSKYGWK